MTPAAQRERPCSSGETCIGEPPLSGLSISHVPVVITGEVLVFVFVDAHKKRLPCAQDAVGQDELGQRQRVAVPSLARRCVVGAEELWRHVVNVTVTAV